MGCWARLGKSEITMYQLSKSLWVFCHISLLSKSLAYAVSHQIMLQLAKDQQKANFCLLLLQHRYCQGLLFPCFAIPSACS